MSESQTQSTNEDQASAPPARKPAPLKFKLALLFGSLLFCFLALEVALRVGGAKPQTATVLSSYFEFDSATGWIGRPDAVAQFTTTNFDVHISHDQTGLRHSGLDWPLSEDQQHAEEVVWCLGDSGTWGWGVDDGNTYVDHLNQLSDGRRVYRNLGMAGFSSVQQSLLLEQMLAKGHKPDRVMVLFCGNDVWENLDAENQDPPRAYFSVVDGKAEIQNLPVPPSRSWNVRAWFKKNSLAYNYLYFYAKSAQRGLKERRNAQESDDYPTSQDRYAEKIAKVNAMAQSNLDETDSSHPQQIALRAAYGKMKMLCDEHEVEFVVASEVPRKNLARICASVGVPLLDISAPWHEHFASSDEPEQTNFATDPHYNELGHQLLATGIHEQLQKLQVATRDGQQPKR